MENLAALDTSKTTTSFGAGVAARFAKAGEKDLFAAFVANVSDVQPKPEPHHNAKPADDKPTAETKPVNDGKPAHETPQRAPHKTKAKADNDDNQKPSAKTDKPRDASNTDTTTANEAPADDAVTASAPVVADALLVADTPKEECVKDDTRSDVLAVDPTAQVKVEATEQKPEQITAAVALPVAAAIKVLPRIIKHEKDKEENADDLLLSELKAEATVKGKTDDSDTARAPKAPNNLSALQAAADAAADKADDALAKQQLAATVKAGTAQAAAGAKHDAKVIDLNQFAAGGHSTSPLLPGLNPGLSQLTPSANGAKAGGSLAASLSNSADAVARPLSLMAQQSESGKASQVRLQRLPAHALTQVQEQVAIKLLYAAKAGEKTLTIQLTPEELGRVDIKLDFKDGNQVSAKITADNPFTLDLLQRDRNSLQQVLADAGLQLDSSGLQFDLRDSGNQQQFGSQLGQSGDNRWSDEGEDVQLVMNEPVAAASSGISADGRVDISI